MTFAKRQGAALVAALLGGLIAFWIYGARVIDPTFAAWLLQGDPAQHYLGSVFFQNEPWHWPPGMITGFGLTPTSVVFTDSIPLVALLAKLAGMEASLQYFGLWMALCHVLSGWFGLRLLQRLGVAPVAAVIGSVFFVVSPTLLMRVYGHEALMGHFLVLAALERALSGWRWPGWLLLVAVSVLVHPYLAAMVALLGVAAGFSAVAEGLLSPRRLIGQGMVSFPVLWATAWLAGYFVGSGDLSADGHGWFSSNLLTWLDRMDWAAFNKQYGTGTHYSREWSRFLPALPQATGGQYEGFAYLGAGMLALVATAAIAALVAIAGRASRRSLPARSVAGLAGIGRVRWMFVLVACAALALLALSAKPSFGSHILFEVQLPGAVRRALGVFRASGRFIWPLTYLLMAWALARVSRLPRGTWLVAAALVVQFADLGGKLKEFRARFKEGPPALERPVVESPLWRQVLERCPRMEMVSASHPGWLWMGPALATGLAKGQFYPAPTARFSAAAEAARKADVQRLLASNAWRADTVYLLALPLPEGTSPEQVAARLPGNMVHFRIDHRDIVVPKACAEG